MIDNLLTPEDESQPQASVMTDAGQKPANVPEKFWDSQSGKIRLEALLNSYLQLERKLSDSVAMPKTEDDKRRIFKVLGAPDTPDAYQVDTRHGLFQPDEDVNRRLHAKGLNNDQLEEVYDLAAEKMVPLIQELVAEFQADREVEKLVSHFGGAEQWQETARQLLTYGRKNLPADVLDSLCSTYEGVLALERMMKGDEPSLKKDGTDQAGTNGEKELHSMMRDPKYWRERDPSHIAKVTEGFRRMYQD